MTVNRMFQPSYLTLLFLVFALVSPLLAHAENKVVVADATYIMGDGESPTFAETMVLQKAKQKALEEAGTYVESYTKVQNLDLTTEEIQTIAGSVLQVEVLENKRSLVGDGLQFYVKIKAIITSDKMEDLAQRIRGKNVAGEYTRLQREYARLNREIESWKTLLQKAPTGKERDAALEEIRVRERDFEGLRKEEQGFFEQVVSGQALVLSVKTEREAVDDLLKFIAEKAHVVELRPAKAQAQYDKSGLVKLIIQGSIRLHPSAVHTIEATTTRLGGVVKKVEWDTGHLPVPAGGGKERHRLVLTQREGLQAGTLVTLSPYSLYAASAEAQEYFLSRLAKLYLVVEFVDRNGILGRCILRSSDLSLLYPVTEYWKNSFDKDGKPILAGSGFSLPPTVVSGHAPLFRPIGGLSIQKNNMGKESWAVVHKDNPELKLSPKQRNSWDWGNNEIPVASKEFAGMYVGEGDWSRRVPLLAIVDSEGYFLIEALIPEEGLQTLEKVTLRFAWAEAVKGGLKDPSCRVSEDIEGLLSAPKPTITK